MSINPYLYAFYDNEDASSYLFVPSLAHYNEPRPLFTPTPAQIDYAIWGVAGEIIFPPIKSHLNFQPIDKPEIGKPVKWITYESSITIEKIKQLKLQGKIKRDAYFNENCRRARCHYIGDIDTTFLPLEDKEKTLSTWDLIQSELTAHHKRHVYHVLHTDSEKKGLGNKKLRAKKIVKK